jgi:hypothetical protein
MPVNESFSFSDLSIFVRAKNLRERFWLRDQREFEDKKTFKLHKTENEGIHESNRKQFNWLASSFSLRRSLAEVSFDRDERNQTGILTSASNLIPPSRFSSVALEFVAVTVAQPSRIFTGFPDI